MDERMLQIKRAHASAKPTSLNPAWQNTHDDLGYVLDRYADLAGVVRRALANKDWIAPAACFKDEEEVIQTRILRVLISQHSLTAPNPAALPSATAIDQ